MKKQLRFLYRYCIASHRWRRWINHQNLLIALITVAFLTVLSWTAPLSVVEGQGAADAPQFAADAPLALVQVEDTPAPTQTPRGGVTATPFPPEFYTNADQTIGITLAGAVLVLIVIFGVLKFLPGKEAGRK